MQTNQIYFDPTRALPAEAYRDPVWLAAEKDKIWHGDWVFATSIDALAKPGDQVPVLIGDQPVLLMHTQAGELAAVSNLCAHRGTLLVDKPTNSKRIQCPYHGWTYEDSGRLLAVPHAAEDQLDKTAHCLPVYRVDSWHGLVFVSLNPTVETLAERFAGIESQVLQRGIDSMRHYADYQTKEEWACNWKVAIMNAMESYHLFKVHATTLEPITPTKGAYYITGSAKATATGGTNKGDEDYLLISLPPGFVGVFTQGSLLWQAVHPIDTHRCEIRTGGAFSSDDSTGLLSRLKSLVDSTIGAASFVDFLSEDKEICERVQSGMSGAYAPGQLLQVEKVVGDFGDYLFRKFNDQELSQDALVVES